MFINCIIFINKIHKKKNDTFFIVYSNEPQELQLLNFLLKAYKKCEPLIQPCSSTLYHQRHMYSLRRHKRHLYLVVQTLSHVRFLCDPVDCSMTDFPVPHYLPELVQTHVH